MPVRKAAAVRCRLNTAGEAVPSAGVTGTPVPPVSGTGRRLPARRRLLRVLAAAALAAGGAALFRSGRNEGEAGAETGAERESGGEAEGVEFSVAESGGKTFTVCRVDPARAELRLFHSDEAGRPFNRFDRLEAWLRPQGKRVVFAMNAGMFHPGFGPVGLYVSGGRTLSPLNTADGTGNFS